jgi:hypothetical protein
VRQLCRADVVQALGVLGVRLSGAVTSDLFEDGRRLALAGFKRLLLENHPDRHAASGHAKRATARAQEVSAAEHLVQGCAWFQVAHLFRSEVSGAAAFVRQWTKTKRRPGRFYKRCPKCGRMNLEGAEHHCHQTCGATSPRGATCDSESGHGGWHSGWSARGRHTWVSLGEAFNVYR